MSGVTVTPTTARSILTRASGFISDYDYTLTPYVGCSFGCSYCYVPTEDASRFRGMDKTWGFALKPKENAPELLLRAAKAGKLEGKRIYLSPNTDPYVGQEKQFGLTRRLLEIFCEYPPALLVIQTRSPLVLRDLDLLTQLGRYVVVAVTVTTDREDVRRIFEPRCPPIGHRVETLAGLYAGGIRTQASIAPLLPCNPEALAALLAPHCHWVVLQALKGGGRGAHTWQPALDAIEERGWAGWLQHGPEARYAIETLRTVLGPERYYEGRDGFGLAWLSTTAPGQ